MMTNYRYYNLDFDKLRKLFFIALVALFLTACGGGGGGGGSAASAPTPEPATPSTSISGVAAIGAALDGAKVEVIDASGNLVNIPDTLTGSDGSYQLTLPDDVALPVIVRITLGNSAPLLSIVAPPPVGTTEIVANINPVTNLVSQMVLGGVDGSSETDLASALTVVDTSTIDAVGDAIVASILGSNVDYDAFANDPNFVAKDNASGGSAADAILDTIANQAQDSGTTLADQLLALATQEQPALLLADPAFQVGLVSELVQGGTSDAEAIKTQLTAIGAFEASGEVAADVFNAVIEAVPAVIAEITSDISNDNAALAANNALLELAIDAAVDVVADTVTAKSNRVDTDATDLVDLLASSSFQSAAVDVVGLTVVPVLQSFVDAPNVNDVLVSLGSVVDGLADRAADVTNAFSFADAAEDVTDLVEAFVTANLVIIPPTLEDLSSDGFQVDDIVPAASNTAQIQSDLQQLVTDRPNLVQGSVDDLIDVVPTGAWDDASWDGFNWG